LEETPEFGMIDCGAGNLRNVHKAIDQCTVNPLDCQFLVACCCTATLFFTEQYRGGKASAASPSFLASVDAVLSVVKLVVYHHRGHREHRGNGQS
jgi:hypothetical protein